MRCLPSSISSSISSLEVALSAFIDNIPIMNINTVHAINAIYAQPEKRKKGHVVQLQTLLVIAITEHNLWIAGITPTFIKSEQQSRLWSDLMFLRYKPSRRCPGSLHYAHNLFRKRVKQKDYNNNNNYHKWYNNMLTCFSPLRVFIRIIEFVCSLSKIGQLWIIYRKLVWDPNWIYLSGETTYAMHQHITTHLFYIDLYWIHRLRLHRNI